MSLQVPETTTMILKEKLKAEGEPVCITIFLSFNSANCTVLLPPSQQSCRKGQESLESRGQRSAGFAGDPAQTAHTPMPETPAFSKGLHWQKALLSKESKEIFREERQHKKPIISQLSFDFPPGMFLQTCGLLACQLFDVVLYTQLCSPHWTLGKATETTRIFKIKNIENHIPNCIIIENCLSCKFQPSKVKKISCSAAQYLGTTTAFTQIFIFPRLSASIKNQLHNIDKYKWKSSHKLGNLYL